MKTKFTIKQNAKGTYFAEFYLNGTRKRYTVKGTSEKERNELARQIIQRLESGERISRARKEIKPAPKPAPKKTDYQTALLKVLEIHTAGLSASSKSHYRTVLTAFLTYCQSRNFPELTAVLAAEYLLTRTDVSPGYYNKIVGQLNTLFARAVELELLPKNIFASEKRKTYHPEPTPEIPTDHQNKVLEYAKAHRTDVYLLCLLMRGAFVRPGEALQLKRKHVNIENGTVYIPGEISKNRKADTVQMNLQTWEALKEYLQTTDGDGETLLIAPGLQCRGTQEFRKKHERILNRLGLPDYRFYAWKHSGIIALYETTKDIHLVRQVCRHSDVKITDIYLKGREIRQALLW